MSSNALGSEVQALAMGIVPFAFVGRETVNAICVFVLNNKGQPDENGITLQKLHLGAGGTCSLNNLHSGDQDYTKQHDYTNYIRCAVGDKLNRSLWTLRPVLWYMHHFMVIFDSSLVRLCSALWVHMNTSSSYIKTTSGNKHLSAFDANEFVQSHIVDSSSNDNVRNCTGLMAQTSRNTSKGDTYIGESVIVMMSPDTF